MKSVLLVVKLRSTWYSPKLWRTKDRRKTLESAPLPETFRFPWINLGAANSWNDQ